MTTAIETMKCNPDDVLAMSRETIANLTAEQIRELFGGLFGLGTRVVSAVAHLYRELTALGHRELPLHGEMRKYIPRIACGAILPETVGELLQSPQKVIAAIAALPIPEQRRLMIDREPIEVRERTPSGGTTVRKVSVENLTSEHVRVAFDEGRFRTDAEQVAIVSKPVIPVVSGATVKFGSITVDTRSKTVKIGGDGRASISDMIEALKAKGLI